MHRPIIYNAHPVLKLIFTLVITIIAAIVFLLFGTVLGGVFFGMDNAMTVFSTLPNETNIGIFKYFQIVQTIGFFLIPAFLAAIFFSDNTKQFLSFSSRKFSGGQIIIVCLSTIALLPISSSLTELTLRLPVDRAFPEFIARMHALEETYEKLIGLFGNVGTFSGLLLNILMIAVLPAIAEELLFRGVFQRFFTEWTKNTHAAIWITAFIFSAIHMSYFGFLPRLVLGAFMGYLLVWSGSIWLPIIAHFTNNFFGVLGLYLYHNNYIQLNPIEMESEHLFTLPIIVGFITLPILLFYLYKSLKTISFDQHGL